MATVVSTRCTYAPTGELPILVGGVNTTIPDELLPVALRLFGVQQVDAPAVEPIPDAPPAKSGKRQLDPEVPSDPQA